MEALLNSMPGSIAQGLIWGIHAIGLYISFRVLDYADLTVDGSFCTGGAVAVMMIINGFDVSVALLAAVAAGMLCGFVTGALHTWLGIPPILSGILTQLGLYSINMTIMGKSNQAISVDKYALVVSLRFIKDSILYSLILIVILIAILYAFFGTEAGSAIRATGCNPDMARAQGINTKRFIRIGLILANGLVSLSGALYAQYQGNADVNAGRGAIVIGLAAIIIGEVLFGTKINFAIKLFSAVVGSVIYYIVITLVLQAGLPSVMLKLFSALIVALFLSFPSMKAAMQASVKRRRYVKGEGGVC